MQTSGWRLGPLEAKFFAWAQMRRVEIVRTGDLVSALKMTPQQEADLFKNMKRRGRAVQLMRGLYLIPPRLPPGGRWAPSPLFVVSSLMRELDADYQITGLVAFNFNGLNTQLPIETSVYNTALSGRRVIAGLPFIFVKVSGKSLGAVQTVEIKGTGCSALIGTLPRTVFDGIYDFSRFGTLPQAYDWVAERRSDKVFLMGLVDITVRYGNISTRRRLGCWLELLKVDRALVGRLLRSVKRTQSFIPLVPGKKASGRTDSKWGVTVNYEASNAEAG